MAWVACDGTNNEMIFGIKPRRNKKFITWDFMEDTGAIFIPSGSIEKLIGRKLTWEDEPVELTATDNNSLKLIYI